MENLDSTNIQHRVYVILRLCMTVEEKPKFDQDMTSCLGHFKVMHDGRGKPKFEQDTTSCLGHFKVMYEGRGKTKIRPRYVVVFRSF